MVKVLSFNKVTYPGNYYMSLFADTKTEVVPGMHIEDVPDGYVIEAGSTVVTADGELAFMKSDGTWNWV